MYLIKFSTEGLADVVGLKKNEKNFLKREIRDRLAKDPVGNSYELHGALKDYRSAHIGPFRVIFKVYEELMGIAIVGIGKHDSSAKVGVYRRLEALVSQGHFAEQVMAVLKGFTQPPAR